MGSTSAHSVLSCHLGSSGKTSSEPIVARLLSSPRCYWTPSGHHKRSAAHKRTSSPLARRSHRAKKHHLPLLGTAPQPIPAQFSWASSAQPLPAQLTSLADQDPQPIGFDFGLGKRLNPLPSDFSLEQTS